MFRLSLQLLLPPVLLRLPGHRLLLRLQGSHPGLQGEAHDDDNDDVDDDDNDYDDTVDDDNVDDYDNYDDDDNDNVDNDDHDDDDDDNNDYISSLTAGVSRPTLHSARS